MDPKKSFKKVEDFDAAFINKHPENYEGFAALYSYSLKDYAPWYDESMTSPSVEVLLKIKNCCKTIYRKGIAYPASGLNQERIMLGYRSQKLLCVKKATEVIVKRTSWFPFLWNHYDSCIRHPFRVAIVIGVISILISGASLVLTIIGCSC